MYNDNHMENCSCKNCDNYRGNHFDSVEDKTKASYYLDSTMVARKPVTVFEHPDTTAKVIKQYAKGSNVGIIYSYVLRDGQLWWQVNWFSGKHQGWVKHDMGLFDKEVLEASSSGKKITDAQEARRLEEENNPLNKLAKGFSDATSGIGETISFAGKSLKWVLLGVIVIAVLMLVYKIKSA